MAAEGVRGQAIEELGRLGLFERNAPAVSAAAFGQPCLHRRAASGRYLLRPLPAVALGCGVVGIEGVRDLIDGRYIYISVRRYFWFWFWF